MNIPEMRRGQNIMKEKTVARLFRKILPAEGINVLYRKSGKDFYSTSVIVEKLLFWGLLDEPQPHDRFKTNMVGIVFNEQGLPYVCEDYPIFLGYVTEETWESKTSSEQDEFVKNLLDFISLEREMTQEGK